MEGELRYSRLVFDILVVHFSAISGKNQDGAVFVPFEIAAIIDGCIDFVDVSV